MNCALPAAGACVLAGLLWAAGAAAQEVRLSVTPTPSEAVQRLFPADNPAQALQAGPPLAPPEQPAAPEAEAQPAAAPAAAPSAAPTWLAPPRNAEPAVQTGTRLSTWALVLSFVALAAAWWFQRGKSQRLLGKQFGNRAKIRVLAESRIGPRAHAVAVEFGGKVFLLGVTDNQVSCLQTLSSDDVAADIGRELDRDEVAATEQDALASRFVRGQPARGFHAQLERSMGQTPRSAADELAEQTSDAVRIKTPRGTELVDIEGQAAGLAARLKNAPNPKRNPNG